MSGVMRVAHWHGYRDLRVETAEVPQAAAGESLIEMVACGVCGTDVHALEDPSFSLWEPPRILGHEGVGIVRQSDVLPHGTRVALEPSSSCGACYHCREGEELLCLDRRIHGGFLADHAVMPNQALHPVGENIPWRRAALVEPLSCVLHAVSRSDLRPGEWCGIIGAGTIGLLCAVVARRYGARVLVSEHHPARRRMAQQLGADVVVDSSSADLEEEVLRHTNGIGLDRVVEAVGLPQTMEESLRLVRRGGTVVIMGVAATDAVAGVRPYDLYAREITLRGSFIRRFDFQRSVRFAQVERLERLISHELPLEQVDEAIDLTARGEGIKNVVVFPAAESWAV